MYELTIIEQNGGNYIDSREVAEVIGKRHDHLLRDIRNYIEIIAKGGLPKVGESDFFIESSYKNAQNKEMPCYLLSKMGCELVANKLTGEKGVLFTAAYVVKFNALEEAEFARLEARYNQLEADVKLLSAMPVPRLGEINACTRIIVRSLRDRGATAEQIIRFVKDMYEPYGFFVADDEDICNTPQMYTAKQIAKKLGIYSVNGNPHSQAIACILNENLFIGDNHKSVVTNDYGTHIGISVRYDDYAVLSVKDWLLENGYPSEVYGFSRTYQVLYKD